MLEMNVVCYIDRCCYYSYSYSRFTYHVEGKISPLFLLFNFGVHLVSFCYIFLTIFQGFL